MWADMEVLTELQVWQKKAVKKQYPDITLQLVLPYNPAERSIEPPPGYDGTYYPEGLEGVPRQYAIVRANKILVDTCDWLIAYVRHGASNSRKILEYAERREKKGLIHVLNLATIKTEGSATE